MNQKYTTQTIMTAAALAALLCLPTLASAQIVLGSAASYAVLAGSTITNTGATTVILGDVGLSPGTAITGLPVGQPVGVVNIANAAAAQAQADLAVAYGVAAGLPCTTVMSGVDLGAKTLTPGVYCFAAAAGMTGTLTLDALGDTSAVFVFQVASALTVAGGSGVTLTNGAQASHVWWQVGSSATLGGASTLAGNILAYTSITINTGATLTGKALAEGGAVTMNACTVSGSGGGNTPTIRATWGSVKSLYR